MFRFHESASSSPPKGDRPLQDAAVVARDDASAGCLPDFGEFIPLSEASRHLPRRNGKKVHRTSLGRWSSRGRRGVVLRTWLLGGVRYTTLEAIREFVERVTTLSGVAAGSKSPPHCNAAAGPPDSKPAATERDSPRQEVVEAALKRFGL